MSHSVHEAIKSLLDSRGILYRRLHHEPTRTSEESARVRGVPVEIGGKAIVMKVDDEFKLFVISAAWRVDSALIKNHLGAKKLRFATPEELLQLTGLVPGSVPPFGHPILPFKLYIEHSITLNKQIAFNAGSLTDSIIMNTEDYLSCVGGTVLSFAA